MQPLTWYLRRLQTMSPQELGWRVTGTLHGTADRCLLPLRQRQLSPRALEGRNGDAAARELRLVDVELGEWAASPLALEAGWCGRLRAQGDAAAGHRLSFFDLENQHLGEPIDWNRDHKHEKAAPMRFAPWIDYRDFAVTGDCKFVWEPNRHHQLVVLGRAYRATGDVRFAAALKEQLDSWLDQCPYGIGMNWRSPLELGIRLINWVWTLGLVRDSGVVDEVFRVRLLNSAYLHLWEISRKYSRGSSVNNHLVGEAAGVYIGSTYFYNLKHAARWRARSREILCEEILRQTYPDGCTREQALGYHLFVLQFFLLAGMVGRRSGEDFPPAYWERLERMFAFVGALTEGGRTLPMFGDADDGYVLDLGGERGDPGPWLAVGAVLYGRADFKAWAGGWSEPALWLLGREGRERFETIPRPEALRLASRAMSDAGYYLLQSGHCDGPDRISVVFDCGELGMGPLAAHGHADAMAFTLRAFGEDVLVDPGTYDYFTYPQWRKYFRSTRAHNTVVIDGQDQSEMLGPFMWGAKAHARCVLWEPIAAGGKVVGEHDGYTRLADPVVHRRTLELDGLKRELTVADDILTRGSHDVEVCFHLAENCRVRQAVPNRCEIDVGPGGVTIELDPRLSVRTRCGSEDPVGGWVSRGYHRKTPSTTLVGRCTVVGNTSLVTRITIDRARVLQAAVPGVPEP
ncbi:MAG: alginate lyase family protein [Planctomycetota bacterium]|nr:alginate lyase family protein [Planctomycetota bacterium]